MSLNLMRKFAICFVLSLIFTTNAYAVTCGDGFDDTEGEETRGSCPTGYMDAVWSDGCDIKCPDLDYDNDGYGTADCDDTNKLIYPGISIPCGTDGWKTCQADGTYTTCSETELCEATGSGDCYYIDAVNGDDGNNGTSRATAWKTQKMFSYYDTSKTPPTGHHVPVAGDVFYFMTGTYNASYANNNWADDGYSLFACRNYDGTASNRIKIKAYPGETPTFTSTNSTALRFDNCDYWDLEGVVVDNALNKGIWIQESTSFNVRNVIAKNVTAPTDDSNVAGLDVQSSTTVNVRTSLFFDNYSRDQASEGNNTQISLWRGSAYTVEYNTIGCSNVYGYGIKWKHGSAITDTISDHYITNNSVIGGYRGIGLAQRQVNVLNNLIIGSSSAGIEITNLGGTATNKDILIKNNTIAAAGNIFELRAFRNGVDGTESEPSNIVIEENILVNTEEDVSHNGEMGLVLVNHYDSNDNLTYFLANNVYNFDKNCYYASDADRKYFRYFGGSPTPTSYNEDTLAGWQAIDTVLDPASYYEDPVADQYLQATSTNCDDKGWNIGRTAESASSSSSSSSSVSASAGWFHRRAHRRAGMMR